MSIGLTASIHIITSNLKCISLQVYFFTDEDNDIYRHRTRKLKSITVTLISAITSQ